MPVACSTAIPAPSAIMQRSFVWLLVIGLLIRLPALWHPIEEGQRNAQTACLTANMFEDGRLRLDPIAPWRGNLDARLVQELPVYNFTALALAAIPGLTLDMAGRMSSLIFWILSFLALQRLWRWALPSVAQTWANLLFIFTPMNWYLSTAFMPESLLQLLSILFMVCALAYAQKGSWVSWAGLILSGWLGLLVKFPGFVHLGLFAALVLADRQGWQSVFRPKILGSAILITGSLALWADFIKTVNAEYFPYWSGTQNLIAFIAPERSRLSISYYIPLAGYNLAFILPTLLAPVAILGATQTWQKARTSFTARVWIYLGASLLMYWLVWGKAAPLHGYYNLQNLVLFSAFFGIGAARASQWAKTAGLPRGTARTVQALGIGILIISGFVGYRYLSRPDNVAVEVSTWIKANTENRDIILYQPRHLASVMDYEHQPLLSHLSGRRTWIWTRSTPDWEKQKALETASFLVVTQPTMTFGPTEILRQRLRGRSPKPPISIAQEYPENFILLGEFNGFVAYKVSRP